MQKYTELFDKVHLQIENKFKKSKNLKVNQETKLLAAAILREPHIYNDDLALYFYEHVFLAKDVAILSDDRNYLAVERFFKHVNKLPHLQEKLINTIEGDTEVYF